MLMNAVFTNAALRIIEDYDLDVLFLHCNKLTILPLVNKKQVGGRLKRQVLQLIGYGITLWTGGGACGISRGGDTGT